MTSSIHPKPIQSPSIAVSSKKTYTPPPITIPSSENCLVQLLIKLKAWGMIGSEGQLLFTPIEPPSALNSRSMERLCHLLDESVEIFDSSTRTPLLSISQADYLVELSTLYKKNFDLHFSTYLRGSYATYVIDLPNYLEELIHAFLESKNWPKDLAQQELNALRKSWLNQAAPNDVDWLDLMQQTPAPELLTRLRRATILYFESKSKNSISAYKMETDCFLQLLIPKSKPLSPNPDPYLMTSLGNPSSQRKFPKTDRVTGFLTCYSFFARDDLYLPMDELIECVRLKKSLPSIIPKSNRSNFWQMVIDRMLNIVRLEKENLQNLRSALTAIQLCTKEHFLIEDHYSISSIVASTTHALPAENHNEIIKLIKERLQNHTGEPLSFVFSGYLKFYLTIQLDHATLWPACVDLAQEVLDQNPHIHVFQKKLLGIFRAMNFYELSQTLYQIALLLTVFEHRPADNSDKIWISHPDLGTPHLCLHVGPTCFLFPVDMPYSETNEATLIDPLFSIDTLFLRSDCSLPKKLERQLLSQPPKNGVAALLLFAFQKIHTPLSQEFLSLLPTLILQARKAELTTLSTWLIPWMPLLAKQAARSPSEWVNLLMQSHYPSTGLELFTLHSRYSKRDESWESLQAHTDFLVRQNMHKRALQLVQAQVDLPRSSRTKALSAIFAGKTPFEGVSSAVAQEHLTQLIQLNRPLEAFFALKTHFCKLFSPEQLEALIKEILCSCIENVSLDDLEDVYEDTLVENHLPDIGSQLFLRIQRNISSARQLKELEQVSQFIYVPSVEHCLKDDRHNLEIELIKRVLSRLEEKDPLKETLVPTLIERGLSSQLYRSTPVLFELIGKCHTQRFKNRIKEFLSAHQKHFPIDSSLESVRAFFILLQLYQIPPSQEPVTSERLFKVFVNQTPCEAQNYLKASERFPHSAEHLDFYIALVISVLQSNDQQYLSKLLEMGKELLVNCRSANITQQVDRILAHLSGNHGSFLEVLTWAYTIPQINQTTLAENFTNRHRPEFPHWPFARLLACSELFVEHSTVLLPYAIQKIEETDEATLRLFQIIQKSRFTNLSEVFKLFEIVSTRNRPAQLRAPLELMLYWHKSALISMQAFSCQACWRLAIEAALKSNSRQVLLIMAQEGLLLNSIFDDPSEISVRHIFEVVIHQKSTFKETELKKLVAARQCFSMQLEWSSVDDRLHTLLCQSTLTQEGIAFLSSRLSKNTLPKEFLRKLCLQMLEHLISVKRGITQNEQTPLKFPFEQVEQLLTTESEHSALFEAGVTIATSEALTFCAKKVESQLEQKLPLNANAISALLTALFERKDYLCLPFINSCMLKAKIVTLFPEKQLASFYLSHLRMVLNEALDRQLDLAGALRCFIRYYSIINPKVLATLWNQTLDIFVLMLKNDSFFHTQNYLYGLLACQLGVPPKIILEQIIKSETPFKILYIDCLSYLKVEVHSIAAKFFTNLLEKTAGVPISQRNHTAYESMTHLALAYLVSIHVDNPSPDHLPLLDEVIYYNLGLIQRDRVHYLENVRTLIELTPKDLPFMKRIEYEMLGQTSISRNLLEVLSNKSGVFKFTGLQAQEIKRILAKLVSLKNPACLARGITTLANVQESFFFGFPHITRACYQMFFQAIKHYDRTQDIDVAVFIELMLNCFAAPYSARPYPDEETQKVHALLFQEFYPLAKKALAVSSQEDKKNLLLLEGNIFLFSYKRNWISYKTYLENVSTLFDRALTLAFSPEETLEKCDPIYALVIEARPIDHGETDEAKAQRLIIVNWLTKLLLTRKEHLLEHAGRMIEEVKLPLSVLEELNQIISPVIEKK